MSKRKTKAVPKPTDPRLQRVLDSLDEISEYNAIHAERDAPRLESLALELIKAALEGGANEHGPVEIERMQAVVALLWADNEEDDYSDEEARRQAMLEIAERAHRITCTCCSKRHGKEAA